PRKRALRRQSLDHPGHPARRHRLLPPHGPLETLPPRPGQPRRHDDHHEPPAHPGRLGTAPSRPRPPLPVHRPRHTADLVDRHRRPPEPHLPRPPRPHLRHALLAPSRPRHTPPPQPPTP